MSTPVVHGHTVLPGGGETQAATPRILAAEPEQRRKTDPGKAERGEEQKQAEEAGKTVSEEWHDGGRALEDDDWARVETPELAAQGGDKEEQADDEWDEWIAEEQRKADAALMSAAMAVTSTHGTATEPLEDDRGGWNGWAAQELCRELAGDEIWRERKEVSGGGAAKAIQGGLMWELEEQFLNRWDGGRAWKRRPRLTWPPEHARGRAEPKGQMFFSATDDPGLTENERWQPGRCIAEKDWGRVLDRPNTKVFRIGDTVAVTEVGNPGLHRDSWRLPESAITRYFVATVLEVDAKQRYYWDPNCNGLLLDEGAGYQVHREHSCIREITRADGTTWEPDMSPMEVDATCDPEQGGGQSQDSGTGYSGIAPKEKTWREITNTDL